MIGRQSIVPQVGEPDIDESYIRQHGVVDCEIGKPVLFMPPFEFNPIEE